MKYEQNPLPIARRYRPLKSAKADGDVGIGKYPGLVSSPAHAFPEIAPVTLLCAGSSLQWRDRFGFEESLINSAPSSSRIFFVLSASINPPHSPAMRPVYFLDRSKNLHQSEGLFYQRFLTEFQIKSFDAYSLLYLIFMLILIPII